MLWYRDHIRQGSWLALIALTINLALSFGHIHAIGGHHGAASGHSLLAAVAAPHGSETPGHPNDGHADYLCPICMAASAMASALVSAPPALPLHLSDITLDRTIEPVGIFVKPPRAAFRSRGPPLS